MGTVIKLADYVKKIDTMNKKHAINTESAGGKGTPLFDTFGYTFFNTFKYAPVFYGRTYARFQAVRNARIYQVTYYYSPETIPPEKPAHEIFESIPFDSKILFEVSPEHLFPALSEIHEKEFNFSRFDFSPKQCKLNGYVLKSEYKGHFQAGKSVYVNTCSKDIETHRKGIDLKCSVYPALFSCLLQATEDDEFKIVDELDKLYFGFTESHFIMSIQYNDESAFEFMYPTIIK